VAPLLLIAVIFRTMEAFKTFDLAFIMSSQETTELIAIKLYRLAFQEWQTGPSCALAYMVLIMVLAITNIYVKYLTAPGSLTDMAAVQSSRQRVLNRAAIAVVLLLTLVYLVPIYWITSTAFKPRSLATTVPPTVLFQPEVTAFVKLFTKRVQMIGKVSPEVYDKAPWWRSGSTTWASASSRTPTATANSRPTRVVSSIA